MSSWLEEELSILQMYDSHTKCGDIVLPQHPDDKMYELGSDFRPTQLTNMNAARSGNFFSNRVQAAVYGQALAVMMKLRHLRGNIIYAPGCWIVSVDFTQEKPEAYALQVNTDEGECPFAISGYFDSMESAEAAIDTIGCSNIVSAYRTLMVIRY